MQIASFLRRIKLSSVVRVAVIHFSELCHKRQDFQKRILNIKCVLIFSTSPSESFLILIIIQRDIILHMFSRKKSTFLSDFNQTSIFLTDFRKILIYRIS